jgi:hypothetical protein
MPFLRLIMPQKMGLTSVPALEMDRDSQTTSMDRLLARDSAKCKTCPSCGKRWDTPCELLQDPEVQLSGYQPALSAHKSGLLLFLHRPCGTTMALDLLLVNDLVGKPILASCGGAEREAAALCLSREEGQPCPNLCVCEFVATAIATVKSWPKIPPPPQPAPGGSDNVRSAYDPASGA